MSSYVKLKTLLFSEPEFCGDLVSFLAHRGPTGGLRLLQCFSSVADSEGMSLYLYAS